MIGDNTWRAMSGKTHQKSPPGGRKADTQRLGVLPAAVSSSSWFLPMALRHSESSVKGHSASPQGSSSVQEKFLFFGCISTKKARNRPEETGQNEVRMQTSHLLKEAQMGLFQKCELKAVLGKVPLALPCPWAMQAPSSTKSAF